MVVVGVLNVLSNLYLMSLKCVTQSVSNVLHGNKLMTIIILMTSYHILFGAIK